MARVDRRGPLVRAITRAFLRAGFGPEELLNGQVKHTDLPWQVQPLHSDLVLEDLRLQEFCDRLEQFDLATLVEFWQFGLSDLHHNPLRIGCEYGWNRCSRILRNTSAGDRNLRFSLPENWPRPEPWAGAVFSMEVAYTVHISKRLPLVRGDEDYYVETEYGKVGLAFGLPTTESPWDSPMDGMVEVLATSPRGAISTVCRYDTLASLRSVLYENYSRFAEAEALDSALQTLRYLEGPDHTSILQDAVSGEIPQLRSIERAISIVSECSDIMLEWMAGDNVKILQIYSRLVPEVISRRSFAQLFWNFQTEPPVVMRDSTLAKVRENLKQLKQDLIYSLPEKDQLRYLKEST